MADNIQNVVVQYVVGDEKRGEQFGVEGGEAPCVVDRHEHRSSFQFERPLLITQEHALLAHYTYISSP